MYLDYNYIKEVSIPNHNIQDLIHFLKYCKKNNKQFLINEEILGIAISYGNNNIITTLNEFIYKHEILIDTINVIKYFDTTNKNKITKK